MACRRYKEKKEVVEPEADPERDQRTVFAYQVDSFGTLLSLKDYETQKCIFRFRFLH